MCTLQSLHLYCPCVAFCSALHITTHKALNVGYFQNKINLLFFLFLLLSFFSFVFENIKMKKGGKLGTMSFNGIVGFFFFFFCCCCCCSHPVISSICKLFGNKKWKRFNIKTKNMKQGFYIYMHTQIGGGDTSFNGTSDLDPKKKKDKNDFLTNFLCFQFRRSFSTQGICQI